MKSHGLLQVWVALISLDINLKNFAVSQNNVYLFKGMVFLNNEWIGIGDSGVYTIFDSQLKDTVTGIPAYFVIAPNIGEQARLRYVILYGEFSGDMVVTITSDENIEKSYTVTPKDTNNKQHTFRIPIRRDNGRGSLWKVKVANVDGSDFSIDKIDVVPVFQEVYWS
jgi:hypothetical protein